MLYVKTNSIPLRYTHSLIFFLVLCLWSKSLSQETILSGTISDTLNTPLQNANVLAIPASQKEQIKFSITNTTGTYTLDLKKNTMYSLEVSYLGYSSYKDSITLQEDMVSDTRLIPIMKC